MHPQYFGQPIQYVGFFFWYVVWAFPPGFLLTMRAVRAVRTMLRTDSIREPAAREQDPTVTTLAHMEAVAAQNRKRVGFAIAQIGWTVLALTLPPYLWANLFGAFYSHAAVDYYVTAFPWGVALLLLTLRPIDTSAIRGAGAVYFCIILLVGYLCVDDVLISMEAYEHYDGPQHSLLALIAAAYAAIALLAFLGAASLSPLLVCNRCECSEAWLMPPRRMLRRLWLVYRLGLVAYAGINLIGCIEASCVANDEEGCSDPLFSFEDYITAHLAVMTSCLVAALVLTPSTRGHVLRRLGELFATHGTKAQEAASVAALLGNRDAATTLAVATERFRALPLAQLTREELAHNKPDPTMHSKTVQVNLGQVDAFVSHSWSDDGSVKFAKLHEWANGETRMVWLDKVHVLKPLLRAPPHPCSLGSLASRPSPTLHSCSRSLTQACIDQLNINDSLACLPVFLAGCKQLLVLAGPTYASRLWVSNACRPRSPGLVFHAPLSARAVPWCACVCGAQCVMELFVFVKMGGTREAIVTRLLGDDEDLSMSLRRFDAAKAKCYLPKDRHHLWAVIEASFGTFHPFNQLVRGIFTEQLRGAAGPLAPVTVLQSGEAG